MNKVIASVGLAALSAATVQAQYAPNLSPLETSKPWSLSATLRGFYDDNYLTLPKNYTVDGVTTHPLASWGTEVIPSAAINHSVEDTLLSASYLYDLRWNENHSSTDQTHEFNGRLEHEFSERYKLTVSDAFVVAQEPTIIDPDVISTPLRVEGNNVHNTGHIDFTDSLTKNLDLHLGYANSIYHYQQTIGAVIGSPFSPNVPNPVQAQPSYSADLDRMEQLATLDLRWKVTDETTGILGYEYGHTDYTSPEYVVYPSGINPVTGKQYGGQYYEPPQPTGVGNAGYTANSRNSDSHFVYLGVDQSFTPELNASIRAGAEYIDYYNFHTSRLSPYVDANLTDQYGQGASAQVGVKHVHNSTDVVGTAGTTPVLDEESTAIYASDSHKLTEHLSANITGQAQLSTFVGGGAGYDGRSEQFYVVQANLTYRFNPWFMTEAGYNYSKLNSELPNRAYTRDFVYLGLRATY
jgi:hypothetical protein